MSIKSIAGNGLNEDDLDKPIELDVGKLGSGKFLKAQIIRGQLGKNLM